MGDAFILSSVDCNEVSVRVSTPEELEGISYYSST
jgi:hypothetical protein